MNKTILQVPRGIRYISEWTDYFLPKGHIIVDKGVTGCGYTEFCLTNRNNVVLCSPRKLLLENKKDQHKKDLNILYLRNDIKDYQGTVDLESEIKNHIYRCNEENEAIKFMITYDSLHYLAKYLIDNHLSDSFVFVIDEFQSIFLDSYFKSDVELDFIGVLQNCPSVLYLSATPMLEKYLERLPEFKDLPYQKLDWSNTGMVEKARVYRKRTSSLSYECGKIIDSYLSEDYKIYLDYNGNPVESKEAVFYLNSVSEIVRIVKSRGLTQGNTRIICSDTVENKNKLKKIGFKISRVPLKHEKNPMFMFCTSTVYIGVDFYSDNARSFIFADPNIMSLGTDISIDLPQITGRQRDNANPFKNEVTIFYKTQRNLITKEDFDYLQNERRKKTLDILSGFSELSQESKLAYLDKIKRDSEIYQHDFVGISEKTNLPVYNYLIEIANERAWEVSQKDYQSDITVIKAIENSGYFDKTVETYGGSVVQDFLDNHFGQTGVFHLKMKMYCEFRDKYSDCPDILEELGDRLEDQRYKMYYEYYGTSGCRAVSYLESDLCRGFKDKLKEGQLKEMIYKRFIIGKRYSMREIKLGLREIYENLGIFRTPKAIDLGEYFVLKKVKFVSQDNKKTVNGYKILGIKTLP